MASVVFVLPSAPVDATQPWLDTTNRTAVIQAYNAEFGSAQPAIGWTGNRGSCAAGTTSQAFRNSIFSRVNFFRSMAGVPNGVTENVAQSAKAQQAALMNAQNGKISHSATTGAFPNCFTAAAQQVVGESNLYLGKFGPDAIAGYMYDPGSGNAPVGHRNWILHPTVRTMGTGDMSTDGGWSSNVLWVFDNVFSAQPDLRESSDFVAWPPRGFVPGGVVYPRWSFSLRGANFNNASVSVAKNGGGISAPVIYRSTTTNSAPFPIIVWEPQSNQIDLSPSVDQTYTVTISGVTVGNATKSFTYDVTIIGDKPNAAQKSPVTVHGKYVTQAYQDFLGRKPQAFELTSWSDRLASGTSPLEFVDALSNSTEWTGFVVDGLYLDTLGRKADAEGRGFWASRLASGLPVATLAASFYGSPEYVDRQGGTHELWVGELYHALLGRSPLPSGKQYWIEQTGRIGSNDVAMAFYQSEENRSKRVTDLYQKFLGRNPDPGGLVWWTNVLQSGDDLQLAAFLASSEEYIQRANR